MSPRLARPGVAAHIENVARMNRNMKQDAVFSKIMILCNKTISFSHVCDFYPFTKVTLQPQTLISDIRHNCAREVQLLYSKMCLNVHFFLANEQNKEIILVYI